MDDSSRHTLLLLSARQCMPLRLLPLRAEEEATVLPLQRTRTLRLAKDCSERKSSSLLTISMQWIYAHSSSNSNSNSSIALLTPTRRKALGSLIN